MQIATLNNLRNHLRTAWQAPGEAPRPTIFVRDPDGADPLEPSARTIASELGLRFIDLDLSNGLTDLGRERLSRPGPRLVLVRNLGLQPPDDIEAAIRGGLRTLILVETFRESTVQASEGPSAEEPQPLAA